MTPERLADIVQRVTADVKITNVIDCRGLLEWQGFQPRHQPHAERLLDNGNIMSIARYRRRQRKAERAAQQLG